jgi:hypothetical protein
MKSVSKSDCFCSIDQWVQKIRIQIGEIKIRETEKRDLLLGSTLIRSRSLFLFA